MANHPFVHRHDLGAEFDLGNLEASKIHAKPGPGLMHGPSFGDLRVDPSTLDICAALGLTVPTGSPSSVPNAHILLHDANGCYLTPFDKAVCQFISDSQGAGAVFDGNDGALILGMNANGECSVLKLASLNALQAQIAAIAAAERHIVSGVIVNPNTANATLRLTFNTGATLDMDVSSLEDVMSAAQIAAALASLPNGAAVTLATTPSTIPFYGKDNQWHTLQLPPATVYTKCDGTALTPTDRIATAPAAKATGLVVNQAASGGCLTQTDTLYNVTLNSVANASSAGNVASGARSFVGGGASSVASGTDSTVGGGNANTAASLYDTVAGGLQNSTAGGAGVNAIGGGQGNLIQNGATRATIGGGQGNRINSVGGGGAPGNYSVIAGGLNNNIIKGYLDVIGGGNSNSIDTTLYYNVINGGLSNQITGIAQYGTIGGGGQNIINKVAGGHSDTIAGGTSNTIAPTIVSYYNTIGGGGQNKIIGNSSGYSTVAGGQNNAINIGASGGIGHFIGGGVSNTITSTAVGQNTDYSAIVGGSNNEIRGSYTTVTGGTANQVGVAGEQTSFVHSATVGGYANRIYSETGATAGSYSSLGGVILGYQNVIAGTSNSIGNVAIGASNQVRGHLRMAFGYQITASNSAGTNDDNSVFIAGASQKLSFHNVAPVARQTLPAVATTAQLTTALRNLGLIA